MIDHYLTALYENDVRSNENRELVEALKGFSNDELRKLANGEMKLASYGDGDVDDWLQKYQGTPLFERAVAIEKQKLELDAAEQAQRQEREEVMKSLRDDTISDQRDQLCLEKRVLDLELATQQAGGAGNADALEAQEGAGLEMAQQAHETEMAQQGKPPVPQTPEQPKPKPKSMTVSVKQEDSSDEGDKPKEEPKPDEKQAMAAKIAAFENVARKMAQQDAKTAALKTAGIGDLVARGAQALKPFGSAVAGGARDVAGAARAGGLKAGLQEAKNVGGVIAQAHPLATAGAAGAAGLGAGMALAPSARRG